VVPVIHAKQGLETGTKIWNLKLFGKYFLTINNYSVRLTITLKQLQAHKASVKP